MIRIDKKITIVISDDDVDVLKRLIEYARVAMANARLEESKRSGVTHFEKYLCGGDFLIRGGVEEVLCNKILDA